MKNDVIDVIFFGGQSNMQGQTESLPGEPPVENAYEYKLLTDEIVPLAHPTGETVGELLLMADSGHGSMLPAFCRAYIKACGRKTVAVPVAKGSTTIADWREGSARYELALCKMKCALRAAERLGRVEKVFYVWLQGESDAIAHTSEEEYFTALKAYRAALQRDVGIDLFGLIEVGYFVRACGGEGKYDEAIMRAQERLSNEEGFAMLADDLPAMSLDKQYLNPYVVGHYSNFGLTVIGEKAGAALAAHRDR